MSKKIVYPLFASCLALALLSFSQAEKVMTKEQGVTIISTASLASDVQGYAGPTPLKIYIKSGKIQKVEVQRNDESPKYFAVVKRDLLPKWDGLTVKKAASQDIDVVTGATYSSKAVIENVRRGLDYYLKSKKK